MLLLSSLSHDLKAPLSLIRLKLDRDNDENEIRLLQGKIDTLIDDINKINKLAHIDSNISNETTQLDLIEIIAQVNENYYDLLKQKKLYVELEFDEDLTILSNDILIKQVINNAYANMYAHAQIDSEIEIKAYKEQDNIIITFYNECESLSENELENIFELFYGTKNNKISSGMGLSIIKQNINELGGKVSFTNERQGVVLKVVLPCV